jgi:hypothetical protein
MGEISRGSVFYKEPFSYLFRGSALLQASSKQQALILLVTSFLDPFVIRHSMFLGLLVLTHFAPVSLQIKLCGCPCPSRAHVLLHTDPTRHY